MFVLKKSRLRLIVVMKTTLGEVSSKRLIVAFSSSPSSALGVTARGVIFVAD